MVTEGRSPIPERQCFVAGVWRATGDVIGIRSPGSATVAAMVHRAGAREVEDAIASAAAAFPAMRSLPTWRRTTILRSIADGIGRRRDELAFVLALEAGKPIRAGFAEVDRARFTFEVAAEEAGRIAAEFFPMDRAPWGEDRIGLTRRFPIGPIAAIIPFNFPLNLAAHKIAPAIAAGNPVVMKPASQTPSAALILAGLAAEAGLPAGGLSVLPMTSETAAPLIEDERLKMLSFTGSAQVGWELKRRVGRKRVTLELGGNAAVIVAADADLARAAERIVAGGYGYSGQSCISVQRVFVHREAKARLIEEMLPRIAALKTGDPLDEATDVGPMITEADAARAAAWIEEARSGGARLLAGGTRVGALLAPTLLDEVTPRMKVSCEEIFAPVVTLAAYDSFDEALDRVNDSRYGLQAGLFTRDAPSIWRAFERLEVGAVMVDEVPTFRMDHMPYGGVKDSGVGREGVKFAIEEMTEIKMMGWRIAGPV